MHANAKAQLVVEVLDEDERVRLIRVGGRLARPAGTTLSTAPASRWRGVSWPASEGARPETDYR